MLKKIKKVQKKISIGVRKKIRKAPHKKKSVRKVSTSRAKPKSKAKSKTQLVTRTTSLHKFGGNPIISPRENNGWESKATFNPAAMYEAGKVHILYRAIGDNDISVVGYASSVDGIHIDERLDEPAYIPADLFDKAKTVFTSPANSGVYVSGGGWWGGAEDPRITRIGDMVYMLYVAFNGWGPPRVALTSITLDDFLNKRWKWKKAKLISQPPEMLAKNPKFKDVVDKNACLLPEKINGKYVVFHRIFPDILVDFVDDLGFKNEYLKGEHKISPRPGHWDSRKVGAGAPPLKTKDGWLLIYQAVGDKDAGRYKIGAIILDAENPAKVLYRSNEPILEPIEWYENNGWKSGVVYPCGAVIIEEKLFIYYGGADSVVCVATANLDEFLEELKRTGRPKLKTERTSRAINVKN